jgi:hypothetical protein
VGGCRAFTGSPQSWGLRAAARQGLPRSPCLSRARRPQPFAGYPVQSLPQAITIKNVPEILFQFRPKPPTTNK